MFGNKNNQSNNQISSPSGEFTKPIDVILSKDSLGSASIEEIIVKSIASIAIGGNAASSFKTLENIKQAGNSFNFKSLKDDINAIKTEIIKSSNQIVSTIDISNKTIVNFKNELINKLSDFEKNIVKDPSDNTLSNVLTVILEGSNVDDVFHSLAEISNDETVINLANAFSALTSNSSNLNKFGEAITPFAESLKDLIAIKNPLKNVTGTLGDFVAYMVSFVEPLKEINNNVNGLSEFHNFLENFAKTKIKKEDIEYICDCYADIDTLLRMLDFSTIDPNNYENLEIIINKLKSIELLKDIDFSGINILENSTELFTDLINKFNSIPEFSGLENISNLLNFLSSIKIESELTEDIKNLNTITNNLNEDTVNSLQQLALRLQNFPTVKNDSVVSLINILNGLDQISIKSDFSSLKHLGKKFKKSIKYLPDSIDSVVEIADKTKGFTKETPIKIHQLVNSFHALERINNMKFNVLKFKLKVYQIKKLLQSFQNVFPLIEEFSSSIQSLNLKNIDKNVLALSNSLKIISELEFNGTQNLNKKELESFVKSSILSDITQIVSSINTIELKKYEDALTSVNIIKTLLNKMSLFKYISHKSMNEENLKNLIITVCLLKDVVKNLDEITFTKKKLKDIDRLLKCIQHIAKIKLKDIKKDKFVAVKDLSLALSAIASTLSKIDNLNNLKNFELFVNKIFANKNAIMKKVIKSLNDLEINNKTKEKANAVTELIIKISVGCLIISLVGTVDKFADAGINVLNKFINSIETIINKLASIDEKKLKSAGNVILGIGKLVAMSALCMIIGGMFMLTFPKVVIASFTFGLALGLFIFIVIGSINLASKGLKTAGDTLKGVAIIVIASAFVMILGAAFILMSPKLVISSIMFGLALGLFIFTVLSSIILSAKLGGIDFAKDTLKEVAIIIIASTFVMILGAAFMQIDGLWQNCLTFTLVLAAFLTGVLLPLTLSSMFMEESENAAKNFVIIVGFSTFAMLVGAMFMYIDGMWQNCLLFTGVLATFLTGVLLPLTLASIFMKQGKTTAKDLAIVVGICATVLLIGGGLFMNYPDLPGNVIKFGLVLSGFIALVTFTLKFLGKNSANIIKGAAAMAIISGVILIASSSMLILRKAVEGAKVDLLVGVGIMSAALLGVGAMAMGLGTLATAGGPFFWAGIGAMAAISGMILMASIAMKNIANSMKTFKEVQGIDFKPILATLAGMLSLVGPLNLFGLSMPLIISASIAIESLAKTISKISEAIYETSSLKIAIYSGTKKIGYRSLNKSDFKQASENIKTIMTVLGKAIISTYKKNPEMFSNVLIGDNPFTRVVKSTTGLAKMISKISSAVKDYADFKIPEYSGTRIVKYRHLGPEDFTKAGENVKNIVRTLSNALISLYNENKEIYTDSSLTGTLFGESAGNTPLSRVIVVSSKIGKLISKIASGVSDMATLKFPIYKNGKIVSYEKLSDAEIVQAGENTKNIVSSLSTALIDLYNANEKLYKGDKIDKTPLGKVIGVSMKIGKLISKIASGVKDMSELRIPEEYNKEGKPINFRQMTDAEIKKAGENTKSIVMTFSTALIDLYNDGNNKDMYDGGKIDKTPLGKVIGVSTKIGKLISKIASGVKDMAELRIPEEYNKEGKPINFRQMTDAEIKQAGKNVLDVVSALGNGLMNTYDTHKEWFDGKIEKTPFYKVISLSTKLGKVIGKIGDAVGKMAKLQIPDGYDKNGKIIKYRQLNNDDFKNASTNVGKVITTLGSAIMSLYDDPKTKDWFCNKDGEILKDSKSPFAIVIKTTMNLSETISKIAKAMKDYAKLRIPLKYDNKGNVIEYEQMGRIHFEAASSNIGLIITNVGNAMMEVYKGNEDWFAEGGNILKKEDSKFAKTLAACMSMGEMISNISSGIIAMAQLMIPDKWDKNGKPISFRQMNETDFTNASTNVGKVVTTIGGALIDLYTKDTAEGMFTSQDDEDTPFNKVAEGCAYLGDLVKNIAEGVSEMATLEATLKKQGIDVDFNTAAENIKKVVTCVGGALMEQFGAHKDWFEKPVKVSVGWGLFKKRDEKADTPFQMMMNACMSMGAMITSIGKGISFFAKQTKDIENIPTASDNIKTILKAIGEAICEVAKDPQWNNMKKISGVISNVHKSANAVSAVANMLKKIGNGTITITDKDGNKINEITLDKATINKSAKTIGDIITGISNGLESAQKVSENNPFSLFNEASAKSMTLVLNMVKKAANVVGENAQLLATLGQNKLKYKDKTGKETELDISDSNMSKGALRIKNVITYVSQGISNAYKTITENRYFNPEKSSKIIELVANAVNTIASNALVLRFMASGEYPLINEKTGDIIEKIKVSTDDLESGSSRIGNIISNIAKGLKTGVDDVKSYIGDDSFEKSAMYKTIQGVQQATNAVGDMAFFLAHLAKNEYVYYDTRKKQERTIQFGSLQNLTDAANTIGTIISSIANGIKLGTANAIALLGGSKSYENSPVKRTLTAVEDAKNAVGNMALLLSHLANNEYVYYDTRKKQERTIQFGSLQNLINAANTIGTIISSIAKGLETGTTNANACIGFGGYQGSKMQQTINAISQAKDAVGPLVLFIASLVSGKYYFKDDNGETKTISLTDDETIKKVTGNISNILDSIAQSIVNTSNKLSNSFVGWENSKQSPIASMFESMRKATVMLGNIAILVDKYSSGKIPIKGGTVVSPNIEQAKTNMGSIVFGIVDIIKQSEQKIKEITGIDSTLITLNKSLFIVSTSLKVVDAIASAKNNILSLANFNIGEILEPVIADIKKSFDSLNSIGSQQSPIRFSLFGGMIENNTPIRAFLNDIDSLIEQAKNIANTPMISSFDILNYAISSTANTISNAKFPEDFGKQVQDINNFIKSVNSIKIEGIDALTELIKELNKMGINMGNLDKLTNAIANKLSVTLHQCYKIMNSLNTTLKNDAVRKDKHKKEIENSVSKISSLMNQTLNVSVKMEESESNPMDSESSNDGKTKTNQETATGPKTGK